MSQELGGESTNILLPDVDFQTAVTKGVVGMMANSGKSCNAPTRMFVPVDRQDEIKAIAKAAAESIVAGGVNDRKTTIGPVVSEDQIQQDPMPDSGVVSERFRELFSAMIAWFLYSAGNRPPV